MRIFRYFLVGLGVLTLLGVSVALVLRDFPINSDDEKSDVAVKEETPPPVAKSAKTKAPVPLPVAENAAGEKSELATTPPAPSIPLAADPPQILLAPPQPDRVSPDTAAEAKIESAPVPRLSLTPAQQAKVRDLLLTHSIMQAAAPDFLLQQGATVPENVSLLPVPHELAEAIPNFQLYSYVIAQDRIVIVATDRREIRFLISI